MQLKKRIITRLRERLDERFLYHSAEHTLHVIDSANEIAMHEQLTDTQFELLQMAALFHDTGYLISPQNHEEHSCDIFREETSSTNLSPEEIDLVCGMIMATKIPQNPRNQLERILADADLLYLGTDDYDKYANLLYEELKCFDPSMSDQKWLQIQIDFLENHSFHTEFGRQLEPKKQEQIQRLKEEMNS
jgi:uncharacterized protein